jgi:hypothetical protein
MNNHDEYLVYTKNNGNKLYYKNKKLHREAGPAIVIAEDVEKYTKLSDEHLYLPTDKPVEVIDVKVGDTKHGKAKVTSLVKIAYLKLRNSSIPKIYTLEDPVEYPFGELTSTYWLEGKHCSKEEFRSIMLKKEMDLELSKSEYQPRKLKL